MNDYPSREAIERLTAKVCASKDEFGQKPKLYRHPESLSMFLVPPKRIMLPMIRSVYIVTDENPHLPVSSMFRFQGEQPGMGRKGGGVIDFSRLNPVSVRLTGQRKGDSPVICDTGALLSFPHRLESDGPLEEIPWIGLLGGEKGRRHGYRLTGNVAYTVVNIHGDIISTYYAPVGFTPKVA